MLAPRIVYKAGFTVVGFAHDGWKPGNDADGLWDELSERHAEICGADPDTGFGFHTWTASVRRYLVGLAVRDSRTVPTGMALQHIEAHAYAVFVHNGQLSELAQTVARIFEEWLPGSAYEQDGDFYFEYYDDRFQPNSRDSVVFVWVPVREK